MTTRAPAVLTNGTEVLQHFFVRLTNFRQDSDSNRDLWDRRYPPQPTVCHTWLTCFCTVGTIYLWFGGTGLHYLYMKWQIYFHLREMKWIFLLILLSLKLLLLYLNFDRCCYDDIYLFFLFIENSWHGLSDIDCVSEGRFQQRMKRRSVRSTNLDLD